MTLLLIAVLWGGSVLLMLGLCRAAGPGDARDEGTVRCRYFGHRLEPKQLLDTNIRVCKRCGLVERPAA